MSLLPKPYFASDNPSVDARFARLDANSRDRALQIEPWSGVAYETNYSDYSAPYGPVQYTRDRFGFVHLRGLLAWTLATQINASSRTMFTMPLGYRCDPAVIEIYMIRTSFGIAESRLSPDGTFLTYSDAPVPSGTLPPGGGYWFSVSNISYYAPPV